MIPTIGRWTQPPDLIEPLVGYRAWRYTSSDRGVELLSLMFTRVLPNNDWEGAWAAWVSSSCPSSLGPAHLAPDESCACGFYALKSLNHVSEISPAILEQAAFSQRVDLMEGVVFGRVQLAGKVIEHTTGYRSERARISELIPTTTDAGTTFSVASRLELPLGPIWDTAPALREMEEELTLTSSERPWRPGLLDRWRLRIHRRRFHLIDGGRNS